MSLSFLGKMVDIVTHYNRTLALATTGYSTSINNCKNTTIEKAENVMTKELRYRDLNINAILSLGPVYGRPHHGTDPSQMKFGYEYLLVKFSEAQID